MCRGYALGVDNWVLRLLMRRQYRKFDRVEIARHNHDFSSPRWLRAEYARQKLPDRARLMPTAFGNMLRAREDAVGAGWRVDIASIWSHVDIVMSDRATNVVASAQATVNVFLNSALLTMLVWLGSIAVYAGRYSRPGVPASGVWVRWVTLSVIACALVVGLYRAAAAAADRLVRLQSASVDLFRLDVYDKLGARRPRDSRDELRLAGAVARAVHTGEPLAREFRRPPGSAS